MEKFNVGLTRDFLTEDGNLTYKDIGLSILDAEKRITHQFFDQHKPVVTQDQLAGFDAVFSLTPTYTADSLAGAGRLLAVARFGVGYDNVDVVACTENNVACCITRGAVNHSVAEGVVTWMLALSHKVIAKDQLVRNNKWNDRGFYMGSEMRDKVLGIIGVGGIGSTLVKLVSSFGMAGIVAFDPFITEEQASSLGVKKVSLEELLKTSDFISLNCPLTPDTKNLIDGDQLALMKPTAYIINTARGGIVNEVAVSQALQNGNLAGLATDVYDEEPVNPSNPLLKCENVLFAPHCIAWTDELFQEIGHMGCRQLVALSHGGIPEGIVNPEVIKKPGFQKKLARFKG